MRFELYPYLANPSRSLTYNVSRPHYTWETWEMGETGIHGRQGDMGDGGDKGDRGYMGDGDTWETG